MPYVKVIYLLSAESQWSGRTACMLESFVFNGTMERLCDHTVNYTDPLLSDLLVVVIGLALPTKLESLCYAHLLLLLSG